MVLVVISFVLVLITVAVTFVPLIVLVTKSLLIFGSPFAFVIVISYL